jgi:hypothetical protein
MQIMTMKANHEVLSWGSQIIFFFEAEVVLQKLKRKKTIGELIVLILSWVRQ